MRYDVEVVELQPQQAAVVRGHVDSDGIGEFLAQAYGEIMGLLARQRLQPAGAPFGRYEMAQDGGFEAEAGFPVMGTPAPEGRVELTSLPGGRAARTMHIGDYGAVGAAYEAVESWLADNGYRVAGLPWECYLDEAEVTNPRTEVFFPCQEAIDRHERPN